MRLGVVDTTFARADMFEFVKKAVSDSGADVKVERYTVPGVKDLPVGCKMLLDKGCNICMALGMPGPKEIDKVCSHEASQGLISAQLMTDKHILEVFVHADEASNDKELFSIVKDRTMKHTMNAIALMNDGLSKLAGKGRRQGKEDEGELR